jgi:alanine racemase
VSLILPPSVSQIEAGATLTIDLPALATNWRTLQAVCGTATCGAVVKADAYGLGLDQVVPTLSAAGCKTFFVAHVFEGRSVRYLAPEAEIYVLNGFLPGTAPTYAELRLRPVLNSLPEMDEWFQFCALLGGDGPDGKPISAAIQVDTGMNRLGLKPQDLRRAKSLLERNHITLILSHLSSCDRAHAKRQVALFDEMRAAWPDVPSSMARSSAIFEDTIPLYDLVRPGYALYGGNPVPGRSNPMRRVLRLEAQVLQVNEVEAGETVGYEGRWRAPSQRRLATIDIGYGDGAFGSVRGTDAKTGDAIVKGTRCPFVGRTSMDLIVLDVTHAPEIYRGEMVELLGETISIDEVAERTGTIGYEVLTRLGQRFYRRYLRI